MDKLFLLQLISSFFVGGFVVALLGIIAERASEKTAGIIISFPSTLALGFFFVSWATSPEKVAEVAPVIPAVFGALMVFTLTYLYLSKIKLGRLRSILLCTVGSLIAWGMLIFPLAFYELKNIWLSLIIYMVLAGIAYYFITVKAHVPTDKIALRYTNLEKLGRAGFSGLMIATAVYLSKTMGPIWGVVFSAFPSGFLSSMMVVSWHYDSGYLFRVWKNSPAGSLVFVIYALSAIYTFPAFGLVWGTLASYLVSGALMGLLIKRPKRA